MMARYSLSVIYLELPTLTELEELCKGSGSQEPVVFVTYITSGMRIGRTGVTSTVGAALVAPSSPPENKGINKTKTVDHRLSNMIDCLLVD